MRAGRTVVALVALVAIAAPMTAQAQPDPKATEEARARLERGLQLFNTQQFAEALEEFQRGYELVPLPELLYAIGQARRFSGDCKGAIRAFEAYLRVLPPPPKKSTDAAIRIIEECRKQPEPPSQPAPVTPPPPPIVANAPEPKTTAPVDTPRRHIASPIFAGVGGAALIAGVLVHVSASNKYNSLADTCAPPVGSGCSEDQISSVALRANTAVGLYIGAGVFGVAAVVAYILERRHHDVITPTPNGVAFRF